MTGRGSGTSFLGPRLAAGVLLALGVLVVIQAIGLGGGALGYTAVGPGLFPFAVGLAIVALAIVFGLRTTLLPDRDLGRECAEQERATHWPTVGLLAALLVLYAVALNGVSLAGVRIPGLGYVLATGLFLPVTARVLGSRSPLRDVVVAFALAMILYVGFTRFLGVRLPGGVLDPLFRLIS